MLGQVVDRPGQDWLLVRWGKESVHLLPKIASQSEILCDYFAARPYGSMQSRRTPKDLDTKTAGASSSNVRQCWTMPLAESYSYVAYPRLLSLVRGHWRGSDDWPSSGHPHALICIPLFQGIEFMVVLLHFSSAEWCGVQIARCPSKGFLQCVLHTLFCLRPWTWWTQKAVLGVWLQLSCLELNLCGWVISFFFSPLWCYSVI